MPRKTGLILAYDRSSFEDADRRTLSHLSPYIHLVKVGLEAMTAVNPESGRTIATMVNDFCRNELSTRIMWDMKLNDIGATVEKAAHNIGKLGAEFFTLHATVSDEALLATAKVAKEQAMTALAVTVLTDLDEPQCVSRFGSKPNQAVYRFATRAQAHGITGLVCSSQELEYLGGLAFHFTTVIPGTRPIWASPNDQKRVMTPGVAAQAGADYLVIGRPILQPPPGMTPVEAAKRICAEIDEALA